MTRARALKTIIRARSAKTGERYTTARRHVLAQLRAGTGGPAPLVESSSVSTDVARPAVAASPVGAVTDNRCREKTGHDLAHWFDVLDRFGALQEGHTAAARCLREEHGISNWYSQGITVAYERARGVRAVNQRTGGFAFSSSKVVTADATIVMAAISETRRRAQWTGEVSPDLVAALSAAMGHSTSTGFLVRADGQARCRFPWDGATVEVSVLPKPGGRSSVVVDHSKLPSQELVDARRAQWWIALGALAKFLAK